MAEHLALAAGVPFLKIIPSDVISMWLGESVLNIRAQFDRARAVAPCILVIDEIDALIPSRSAGLNMHVDQQNLVNEILAQMNNVGQSGVIVIGTTNRLSALDTAAIRSGRFDYKLPIYPPTEEERRLILKHHVGQQVEDPAIEKALEYIAEQTPLFTSADLAKIVQDAKRMVLSRRVNGEKDGRLTVRDLELAMKTARRSLRKSDVDEWLQEVSDLEGDSPRLARFMLEYERVFGSAGEEQ